MAEAQIILAFENQKRAEGLAVFFSEQTSDFSIRCIHPEKIEQFSEKNQAQIYIFHGEENVTRTLQIVDQLKAQNDEILEQCIVCFDVAKHQNRRLVGERALIDYVFQDEIRDINLLALIKRLISKQLIASKLDFASQQFQMIVENSNDGIYVFQDSGFVYVNPKLEAMLGYSAKELCSPDFPLEKTIAIESRAFLKERFHKLRQGIPVPSRYQLKALNKNNRTFDAEVSISYLDFQGYPSSLGVMQDITERKRYEKEFVRKNRELALLNDVSDAINNARSLQEILETGSNRLYDLLNLAAIGISLLDQNDEHLILRFAVGLSKELKEKLQMIHRDSPSLLAEVIRNGETKYISDLQNDERIYFESLRRANYQAALIVPLKAQQKILGVAFIFSHTGAELQFADRKLMYAVGVLLGTAIRKAAIFEQEKTAVKTLSTIDSIAKSISSRLEINEVAIQLGEHLKNLFKYDFLSVAKYTRDKQSLYTLHRNEKQNDIYLSESFTGTEQEEFQLIGQQPLLQMLKTKHSQVLDSSHPYFNECGSLFTLNIVAYKEFIITPIFSKDNLLGVLFLAFKSDSPIEQALIQTLEGSASYMAIAMKNSELFAGRNRALVELKNAQKKLLQSEQLRALGEMAAGVAHDFNNVLSAILGRAQLLKSAFEKQPHLHQGLLKHAEIIEQAAFDGAETVRRIQEIGKQKGKENFTELRLYEILEDVFELTKPKWKDQFHMQNIDFLIEANDKNIKVYANPHELREVLVNFVHNAVDAMQGQGCLRLSLQKDTLRNECFIHIEDDGPGISDELKSKVFEPFFTTKGQHGTGLGLSVSMSIIERHQGDLRISEEKRESYTGAHFIIGLPCLNSESNPTALLENVSLSRQILPQTERQTIKVLPVDSVTEKENELSADDINEQDVEKRIIHSTTEKANEWEQEWTNGSLQHLPRTTIIPQILVIDDEENIRDLISDFLSMEGCQIFTAPDGHDGLALVENCHFDLIFTDLSLPDMNGVEVAQKIREINDQIPICLVTGWQGQEDDSRDLNQIFDHILNKPFKVEELLSIIRQFIHKSLN